MKIVIFANGIDYPGIGANITKILYEKNCKIDDFKIITIDELFSLIVSISCTNYIDKSEVEETLKEAVRSFNVDIKVVTEDSMPSNNKFNKEEWIPYEISIICNDQTEVLFYFMKEMSNFKVNISDVRCHEIGSDPDNSYKILINIEMPISVSYEMIKSTLDEISRNLNVLVEINPINTLEL